MKVDTLVARFEEAVKAGTPEDQILAKVKTDDLGWNVNKQQGQGPAGPPALLSRVNARGKKPDARVASGLFCFVLRCEDEKKYRARGDRGRIYHLPVLFQSFDGRVHALRHGPATGP